MNQRNDQNRRDRFRVRFPAEAMLSVNINGFQYDVVEVAELSLVVASKFVVNENGNCKGVIVWSDGRAVPFSGRLGRVSHLGRVIENIMGFTTHDVLKEQRRLLRSFPAVDDSLSSADPLTPVIFQPETE